MVSINGALDLLGKARASYRPIRHFSRRASTSDAGVPVNNKVAPKP